MRSQNDEIGVYKRCIHIHMKHRVRLFLYYLSGNVQTLKIKQAVK